MLGRMVVGGGADHVLVVGVPLAVLLHLRLQVRNRSPIARQLSFEFIEAVFGNGLTATALRQGGGGAWEAGVHHEAVLGVGCEVAALHAVPLESQRPAVCAGVTQIDGPRSDAVDHRVAAADSAVAEVDFVVSRRPILLIPPRLFEHCRYLVIVLQPVQT